MIALSRTSCALLLLCLAGCGDGDDGGAADLTTDSARRGADASPVDASADAGTTARVAPDDAFIAFADDALPAASAAERRFYLVDGDADAALASATRVDIGPRVDVAIDGSARVWPGPPPIAVNPMPPAAA